MTLPIDEGVGQMRRTLVELGIDQNTLCCSSPTTEHQPIFPAAAPSCVAERDRSTKAATKFPPSPGGRKTFTAATESDELLITIDVMPTLLKLAGADPPTGSSMALISPQSCSGRHRYRSGRCTGHHCPTTGRAAKRCGSAIGSLWSPIHEPNLARSTISKWSCTG